MGKQNIQLNLFLMEKLSESRPTIRDHQLSASRLVMIMAVVIICLNLVLMFPSEQVVTDMASEMTAGTWTTNPRYMTFGYCNGHSLVWRVLEVKENDSDFGGNKTAFLLLNDLLWERNGNVIMTGFDSSNNSFPNSAIKRWLNDGASGFLTGLNAYQASILDTTYSPDNASRKWSGSAVSGTSKVFLLSVGEANNKDYFADNADRAVPNTTWWLRSPGFVKDIAAVVFNVGDVTRNGLHVSNICAVRPALKINLSHNSVFTSVAVSYGLSVLTDDGINPISGAKVSLVPSLAEGSAEAFSNSVGIARFVNVMPGKYTVTVSKPGYAAESRIVSVPTVTPVVDMMPDIKALPERVNFGIYNGEPIEWCVLDIVNDKALLFAGALFQEQFDIIAGSSTWANSSLRAQLNSRTERGFLQEANFSAAEVAAIDAAASATGDSVFLLSSAEVFNYLPDAYMRYFDDKEWLMRSPRGEEDVEAIRPDGEYGGGIPAFTRNLLGWIRPAMWVNLNMLTYDSGTNTLFPTHRQLDGVP